MMALLPLRLVVACSLLAAGLVAWFSAGVQDVRQRAWADLVRDVSSAETLQLQVRHRDRTADIYVRQPGQIRWERSSTDYAVVDGTSFWQVEAGQLAGDIGNRPPWLNDSGRVDLLSLLDVSTGVPARQLMFQPAGEQLYAGQRCQVHSRRLSAPDEALRLDVYTELKTGHFVALVARGKNAAVTSPPVAEVRLVALNPPLEQQRFEVSATLADRNLGKVTDVQGLVTLQPRVSDRWTLVCRETPLEPGDWVRTNPRGAHAARLSLRSGVQITIGPGTLLEIIDASQVRVTTGELQIERTAAANAPFHLRGPGNEQVSTSDAGKQRFRITRDDKLQPLEDVPSWLAGFEGATANESIGSLIVNIDGRNEPLTVGEHKVTVDIRDQIARTTIEETFVNRTSGRLEGQFHFPLPQDASISGFGMWIGNELVEADIVEKQRAREIYETILREKRDPGLLEWTGGNIFKARVFPIEPFSEKRIKITYTQVLPLRANRYRYSYGLRSELLQKFPLRELSLQVNVHSALPLKSVASPTHACRTQATEHSARLEFTAREHTPSRDFEVVCEVDGAQSQVVVVPHRRGEDGYLLLQLMPPSPEGNWQREILPSGEPADLLVLCDTSGSMDPAMRQAQSEFVAALLSALGPKDRFNLGVADVETTWLFPEAMTPTPDVLKQVHEQLAARVSLGWSNLDAMAAAALARATSQTQIVYVGDGMVTGVESDPQAFITRLRRLSEETTANNERFSDGPPTWHAISVGNTSEAVVLRAMSNMGHGTVRQITSEQPAAAIAHELLNEILQPGLKDLQVEFRGVKMAAVYPERLPNLPAGMQQILVGRYLPTGEDQQGEVVITGRRGGETVRYVAQIQFRDAEAGNSFIPRLWARAHLDQLLQQGTSDVTKDEIIRLSEEFHIITPYTSLLVLETDADRERFGVRKRYQMRDGERFFADGKTNIRYDLMQQQMRAAERWRLDLRKQILAQWALLGRDPRVFDDHHRYRGRYASSKRLSGLAGSFGGAGGALGRADEFGIAMPFPKLNEPLYVGQALDELKSLGDVSGIWDSDSLSLHSNLADQAEFPGLPISGPMAASEPMRGASFHRPVELHLVAEDHLYAAEDLLAAFDVGSLHSGLVAGGAEFAIYDPVPARKPQAYLMAGRYQQAYERPTVPWLDLFPALPASAGESRPRRPPAWWTAEILELVQPVSNELALRQLAGGIELRRSSERFLEGWQRMAAGTSRLELFSPTAWLAREAGPGQAATIEYSRDGERGIWNLALHLGRVRPSQKSDLSPIHTSLLVKPLEVSYRQYIPALTHPAPDRLVVSLRLPAHTHVSQRLTIDTTRNVILLTESLDEAGKVTFTQASSDFVQIAGRWFPTRIVATSEGRETSVITQQITALEPEAFAERMTAELAARDNVFILREPLPRLSAARWKIASGQAAIGDRLSGMIDATLRQQWDELFQHLTALEQASPDHPGLAWLRIGVERTAGRHEEARRHLSQAAERLVADESPDALARAQHVLGQAYGVCGWNEYGEFVTRLRSVYARQPDAPLALHEWKTQQANVLRYTGREGEFLALRQEIAAEVPGDSSEQATYAKLLAEYRRYDDAYRWLQQAIESPLHQSHWKQNELRSAYASLLRQQARWTDLVRFYLDWNKLPLEGQGMYGELLSALLYANDIPQAEQTVRDWLSAARVDRKLTSPEISRFNAAFDFATGQVPHISSRHALDPKWFGLLEETAKFFVAHPHHAEFATRVVSHYRFQSTDAADRIRGVMRQVLNERASTLPADVLQGLITQCLGGRCLMVIGSEELRVEQVSQEEWTAIARTVRERWSAERTSSTRRQLGDALVAIYSAKFAGTEHIPFLRKRLAISERGLADRGPDFVETLEQDAGEYAAADRQALFEALLQQPWTETREQELFALLPGFRGDQSDPAGQVTLVSQLLQLVDRLQAARITAASQLLTDAAETEKLTRTELQARQKEIQRAARQQLSDRLAAEAAKHADNADLAAWLRMERATLDVQLDRDVEAVLGECWELLGAAPPHFDPEAEMTAEQLVQEQLLGLLRQRALTIVLHLASRPAGSPELVARVLSYIDAGMQQPGEQSLAWQQAKYHFLMALDRPEDLERALQTWIATDPQQVVYQLALAKIRAERGDVPDAIQRLEAVQRTTPLSPADLHLLSQLYLAVDRRADHERSRRMSYEQVPEWQLSNMINQHRSRLQNHVGEVDERLLDQLHALFAKASAPENYLWQLRDLYRTTRDFRLLRMLPDIALGRTREREYAILQSLDGQVLDQLNEAAADEVLARVRELRAETQADLSRLADDDDSRPGRQLDLRALDLVEALVERRSSEVPNQGRPHAQAAVAALKRAFDGEWQAGERLQYAQVLQSFKHCSQAALAVEQLRQLRELVEEAEVNSEEQWRLTSTLAQVLYWHYSRGPVVSDGREEALALQEGLVRSVLAQNAGRWPSRLWPVLDEYLSQLRESQRYSTAEALIDQCLARTDAVDERNWLDERQMTIGIHALRHGGRVRLGEGDTLFANLLRHAQEAIQAADDNQRHQRIEQLLTIFDAAFERRLSRARAELTRFSFENLPALLTSSMSNYHGTISRVADRLGQHIDKRTELRYLITALEQYPSLYRYSWDDAWNHHGSRLARCRLEAGPLGDLTPRLLKLVLHQLQAYLITQESHGYEMFRHGHHTYWAEQEAEFVKVAEEVLQAEHNSPRIITQVAEYLFHGANRKSRGIEVMSMAHRRGLLDEHGLDQLTEWLALTNRYGEAAPLLEALVDQHPRNLTYRTRLMIAYYHTQRPEQLRQVYDGILSDFRKDGLWTDDNMASVAYACLTTELNEAARELFTNAIQRRQRDSVTRGIGDETLSRWYQHLARANANLNRTADAVEAACGAIVCWPMQHHRRTQALETLKQVIHQASDLDAYVASVDDAARETGQDSPLIRQAIGQAYRNRGQLDRAVAQLRLAQELQPTNREVNEALLAVYEELKDEAGGIRQLLAMIAVDRHNLALYQQLAERTQNDAALAERAVTSMIESGPQEPEHHQALAEWRQKQNCYGEAILHWERVAELRKLEPTGRLKLAAALIHERQFDRATESLRQVLKQDWPDRFANAHQEARQLQRQIPIEK